MQEGDDLQTQWVANPLNSVLNELRASEFRGRALAHGELHVRDVMGEMARVSRGRGRG